MKTIKEIDLNSKKVIIRCDFNVPIKNGIITDDNRIIESLETINYAINKGAKIILMSHLGRVEEESDKINNSLMPVSVRLSELLNKEVTFVPYTRGELLEEKINNLKNGDVLLMENTRFEDVPNKFESKNNADLGIYWASLGEIFINDAFGTAHRAHASNVGIATHLNSAFGFLIEKELKELLPAINNPNRPLTVILGGSKVVDKIGVIKNLVKVADYILIGGGMAYTFLKAKDLEIGHSILDTNSISFCKEVLDEYSSKIILPLDVVCSDKISSDATYKVCDVNNIDPNMMGVDIGPKTINLFKKYIDLSNTIIWNGPVGVFEIDIFANGTKEISKFLSESKAKTIIGGGDSAAAVIKFGYKDKISHISTGGGASLELLEGKILPGIDIVK